jgi:hypothetical protein
MITNLIAGGGKVMSGDYLEGFKQMFPVALKGPTEAFRMTEKGYVDSRGNALPMEAGASDVLSQALGFTPQDKAEYNEQQNFRRQRQGEMSRAASTLRQRLVSAIESGDRQAFRENLVRAREFDQANPAFAVLPRLPGVLKSRAADRVQSEISGTPLGMSPRDLRGIEQMRFANYN